MSFANAIDSVLRPHRHSAKDVQMDLWWLCGLWLVLIASGCGLRDPWPADEPRFALIARDMVSTGDWLVPRVAGDIYADKPPLFFWLIAAALKVTGSLRFSFLFPSILAGLGTTLLVYDLARRLWSRDTGLIAGICLLFTVQFVWQARQAQIDATLCFWTTLSLYGLLRHLLLGPTWHWYAVGWLAAGLGVITKGVGFIPLLILIPFTLLRSEKWSPRYRSADVAKWWLGPPALLVAIGLWLVPVVWMSLGNAELSAYRDEILFRQTLTRYANAWHHQEPFWYFILEVIPWLWLPMTALMPWLVPRWRAAWQVGDLRVILPLAWVLLVVVFFSVSSGKRGVYVLPAVPAFVLACAPFVRELGGLHVPQRVLFGITAFISSVIAGAAVAMIVRHELRVEIIAAYSIDPLGALIAFGVATTAGCALSRPRRGVLAYCLLICTVLVGVSFWINPAMNSERSGTTFINMVEGVADARSELGIIAFKEQYMLQLRRPITHFGHARWREADQEAADAARWLAEKPGRQLIVPEAARELCFSHSPAKLIGAANRVEWYLISAPGSSRCAALGQPQVAIHYNPAYERY